jgi:hypothetical protein
MSPFFVPYEPSEQTPMLWKSPSGVGLIIEWTVSTIALAALAALDAPRSSITAEPLFLTILTKSFFNHSSSPITSSAGFPQILAL